MANLTSILFALSVLVSLSVCVEKARFDFYRVYEVTATDESHLKIFQQILDYPDGYNFMTTPKLVLDVPNKLIVPPHKFGEWSEWTENFKLNVELLNNNLQESIDKEDRNYQRRKGVYDWSSYRRLNETYAWMDDLAASRPNDISTFIVGKSYEGRDMKGLRVNIGNKTGKKAIFFESNIHANEWIGSYSTTYIMNQLLTSDDDDVKRLLETFDWWFLPILNIDGYEYTWNVDRTWRKTRRPTQNPLCHGADPNRNSDVSWGVFGGSTLPCSAIYYGDHAFSEVEMKQFSEFIATVPNLFGYISFHSHGQYIMTPYALSRDPAENFDLLNSIGAEAKAAIFAQRGKEYRVGSMSDFFGLIGGTSVDYVVAHQNPLLAYCYEISDTHIVPTEELLPIGAELFASVRAIFNEAITRGLV
ncbi:zinc carboxypeptidase-like [Chironomus tepperi]|uniref:zinc carboxypeptidase-like n=1 Tax=Chironomus tepperi TaxID=113505 RepID=UPI00391FA9B2